MRILLRTVGVMLLVMAFGVVGSQASLAVPDGGGTSSSSADDPQLTVSRLGHGRSVDGFIADPDNPFDSSTAPYPTSNPTTGFTRLDEDFAGVIHATPAGDGAELSLYSMDLRTATGVGIGYELGAWDEAHVANIGLVARLLGEYDPNTGEPTGLTDNQRAAAVQAAIWYFTDSYVLHTADPVRSATAQIVAAVQGSGPLLEPDPPTLSISPLTASGPEDSIVGPFTVNTDGASASARAVGGTMYRDAAGKQHIAPGTPVPDGTRIWIRSTGTTDAVLTVEGTATVPTGNVEIYDGSSQQASAGTLILATTAQLTTHVSATANFQESGSLHVRKTITGGAAGDQGSARISVICGTRPYPDFLISGGTTGTVSRTYSNIPAGSVCRVTEVVDGSTSTVTATITGGEQQATVPASGTATVDISDRYESQPGSLTVYKTIAGGAAGSQGAVRIRAVCDGTALTPDFVVPARTEAGQLSHSYPDVAGNSECTVTEIADGSTDSVRVTSSGGGGRTTVPIGGSASMTITDDYEYQQTPGSLTVRKTISGPAAGQQATIKLRTVCDGETLSPDLVIPAAATGDNSHTYHDLAPGAVCTVTEDRTGATSDVAVTTAGHDNATIESGSTARIHLTDTFNLTPGSLAVRMLISGPAAGHQGRVVIHTVCDGAALSPDLIIGAGSDAGGYDHTYTAVPAGAECTATETSDGSSSAVRVAVTGSGEQAAIPSAGTAHLGLQDQYEFNTGSLTVTQTTTGSGAGQQAPVIIHTVCNSAALEPDVVIPAGAIGTTSHTYTDIAAGSVCVVSETSDGHTESLSAEVTGTGPATIKPGETTTADITNAFEDVGTGSLVVQKTIAGAAAGSQGLVTIVTDCGAFGTFTWDVAAGTAAGTTTQQDYDGIPPGTSCTVTEAADGSGGDVTADVAGDGRTTTVSGTPAVVGIVDTFSYRSGSLTVTKAIAGPAAGDQGEVRIQTVCNGEQLSPDLVIPAGATDPASHTYTDLPGNATCVVTETSDGGTDTVKATIDGTGQEVTVPPGDVATVDMTDTYDDAPGAVLFTKTIAGPAAGQQGAVTIEITCGDADPDVFTIPAGSKAGAYQRSITGIPAGTSCHADETADGSKDSLDVRTVEQSTTWKIGAGETVVGGIVDSYTDAPGSLTVSKRITGPAAGDQGKVVVRTVCDRTTLAPDLEIPAGADAGTTSHTYTGLPGGATCVITELSTGATATTTTTITGNGRQVTIPAGGSASATVTDTYHSAPGALQVAKTIGGPRAGQQGVVSIEVRCGDAPVKTFTVPAGQAAGQTVFDVSDIPAGTRCTVTEIDDGTDAAVKADGDRSTQTLTIPAGGRVTAQLTNFYHSAPGTLRVTKTITGHDAGQQGDAEILISCPALGRAAAWVIPAGTATGSQHRYVDGVPAGAVCTVTETASGASKTVSVTAEGSGDSATIRANRVVRADLINTVTAMNDSGDPTPGQSTEPTPDQSTPPTPGQSTPPTPGQSTPPTPDQSTPPTPDQSTPPTPDQSTPPTPGQSGIQGPSSMLPDTGAEAGLWLAGLLGIACIGIGALLLAVRRRTRS